MNENGMMKAECPKCDFYLATINAGEVTIRVKEHFVYVRGGAIRLICVGCGSEIILIDDKYEKENPQEVAKLRAKSGVLSAKIDKWISRKQFNRQK